MPQSPEDLSELIRRMAEEEARGYGIDFDNDALDHISTIPKPYSSQSTIRVDQALLRKQIRAIVRATVRIESGRRLAFDSVSSPTPSLSTRDLLDGLKSVECHYLWFC